MGYTGPGRTSTSAGTGTGTGTTTRGKGRAKNMEMAGRGGRRQSPNRSAGFLVGIRKSLFPTVTQYWGHYERRPRDSGEWEWAPLDVLNYRLSQSGWNQGPSSCLAQSAGDSARRSNTSGTPRAMPALYPPGPLCFLLPFVLPFF